MEHPEIQGLKMISLQKKLNTIFLGIIVIGLLTIGAYVAIKASQDPVKYVSLTLDKSEYVTGEEFTYTSITCRDAGPEVSGIISRTFVPMKKEGDNWVKDNTKGTTSLFSSVNVSDEKGCVTIKRTTLVPYLEDGYYVMNMTGDYNVLNILPPSVDSIDSKVIKVTRSKNGPISTEELRARGYLSGDSNVIIPGQTKSTTPLNSTSVSE